MNGILVNLITREKVRDAFWRRANARILEGKQMVDQIVDTNWCKALEQAVWDWSKDRDVDTDESSCNHPLYEYKTKQMLYALIHNAALLSKKYTPTQLVVLDDRHLAEGTQADDMHAPPKDEVNLEDIVMADTEDIEEMPQEEREVVEAHAMMICRKCRGTDIQWELKQTRGADEPMTEFCYCKTCGTRWRN